MYSISDIANYLNEEILTSKKMISLYIFKKEHYREYVETIELNELNDCFTVLKTCETTKDFVDEMNARAENAHKSSNHLAKLKYYDLANKWDIIYKQYKAIYNDLKDEI